MSSFKMYSFAEYNLMVPTGTGKTGRHFPVSAKSWNFDKTGKSWIFKIPLAFQKKIDFLGLLDNGVILKKWSITAAKKDLICSWR